MIKTLAAQIKEFKKDSILTPCFMILEVIMEMVIPLMMASIIDDGVEAGDIHHIYMVGIAMVIAACIGLCRRYGRKIWCPGICRVSQGIYARPCMTIFRLFFFQSDKFSTADSGNPSDDRCDEPAECISDAARMCMRAPASLIIAMIMAFSINARLAIYLVAGGASACS